MLCGRDQSIGVETFEIHEKVDQKNIFKNKGHTKPIILMNVISLGVLYTIYTRLFL